MFQLTLDEYNSLRFQFGILKKGQHSKYLPYAFTEHGILMLSSALNSERAIHVNIQIMRTFTKIREIPLSPSPHQPGENISTPRLQISW